jgi:hypothetical protein
VRVHGADHIAMVNILFHVPGCGTYDGRRYIDHQSDSRASSDVGMPVARLGRTPLPGRSSRFPGLLRDLPCAGNEARGRLPVRCARLVPGRHATGTGVEAAE